MRDTFKAEVVHKKDGYWFQLWLNGKLWAEHGPYTIEPLLI